MKEFRLQNYLPHFSTLVLATSFVIFLLAFSSNACAKQSFSSDELFDKSLADLHSTMEKAKSGNEAFRENNRSLRKEVDRLEQAISDAQVQKSETQKEVSVFFDTQALEDKERALYEARVGNLSSRLARYEVEKTILQKKIKSFEDQNKEAQNQIAQLKEEIEKIQSSVGQNKSVSADNPLGQSSLAQKLESSINRIHALQAQLASQKKILQDNAGATSELEKFYADLTTEFSLGQEQLARLQAENKLVVRQADVVSAQPSVSESSLHDQISGLKDYRQQLKKSLSDLQKALSAVNSGNKMDLSVILKKFEQKHALLKENLALLEKKDIAFETKPVTKKTDLLADKKRLETQRNALKVKIAGAKKEYEKRQMPAAGLSKSDAELKNKIKQSSLRLRNLQAEINAFRKESSLEQKNQDLDNEAQKLEKDLQALRSKSTNIATQEEVSSLNQDEQALRQEIDQLQSRRAILDDSVSTINSKYQVDDISAKDSMAKEVQLKEYLATLTLENSALQEKLLTLQMQQDKKP